MKHRSITRRSFLPFIFVPSALRAASKKSALPQHRIDAAAEYSARNRGKSLLITQGERVIFEDYPNGFHANEGHKIYSGTKGFWNLAAVAAEEDGILRLKERAVDTLPEWEGDRLKSRITIRQLLNFSSGLDPYFELHEDGIRDRDALAIRRHLAAEPGDAFIYGPCSLQVFHLILKRKLARRGELPKHYLERRVLRPMGLGPQRYVEDSSGNPLLAAGFILSARQWVQMGKIVAAGGRPVVSPGEAENLRSGSSPNNAFGLGFWNNSNAGSRGLEVDVEAMLHEKWPKQNWRHACLCRSAPDELIASVGSGSQRLYVVPSSGLVVVRQGMDSRFSDAQFLRLLFAS